MNWDRFEDRIEELFHHTRFATLGGGVRVPDGPVDAFEAFLFAAEDDDERRFVDGMRGGFLDIVEADYDTELLFLFHWDDGGRCGWETYLSGLRLRGGGLLVYHQAEAVPIEFFALIERGTPKEGWSAFIRDLLGSNGSAYGVGLFGYLPPGIMNCCPDLVAPESVKEGCRRILDEGLGSYRTPERAWRRLRNELIGRALAPFSLRGYRALPDHDPGPARGGAHREGDDRPALPSEEERTLILENYFDLAYRG